MNSKEKELIKNALIAISLRDEAAITKRLENEPTPPEEFYKELDEKVKKKIRENEKHVSLKKTITILIAAALLISIFSITAFAGEKIKDFFVEVFDTHITLSSKNEDIPSDIHMQNIYISYIPEKFIEVTNIVSSSSLNCVWKKDDSEIFIWCRPLSNGSLNVDNENSNYTTIQIKELTIHRTEISEQISCAWTDGKVTYLLTCTGVEWEEMVKIIEGITLTESE